MRNEKLEMRNANEQLTVNSEQWGRKALFSLFIVTCSLFIVLACQNPFEPPQQVKPEAGKGYFSLNLGEGRTIRPLDVMDDFAEFKLEFFAEGENANPVMTVERTPANLSDPILMDAGNYDLYVSAWFSAEVGEDPVPAAHGELTGIVIGAGETTARNITLVPVAGGPLTVGEGTFSWAIDYPDDVVSASLSVTPMFDGGTAAQVLYFIGGTPLIDKTDSLTLNSGYYRVVFRLQNSDDLIAEYREVLHIYQDRVSVFTFTFEAAHFVNDVMVVTNGNDAGEGSLRQAITDVPDGGRIIVAQNVKTIALEAILSITKSMTIYGNGVTVTRASTWTAESSAFQLMYINSATAEVTVSRVLFKDGRATGSGTAIYIGAGNMNLESCIFSGNRTSGASALGGAIYKTGTGTLNVKSSTFYDNSTPYRGGAIYIANGTLTLTGNLFYGNTAVANGGQVVYRNSGTVTSNGYNVVDIALGTETTQSGWIADASDKTIDVLPVSPASFRLFSGSPAANVITSLPEGYPAVDFYGDAIADAAAAGAVQSTVSGSGYYLGLSVNNSSRGSVSTNPAPDADGLYSGNVTITASPAANCHFASWLVDGTNAGSVNPLPLTLTDHTNVQAVFSREFFAVTDFTDTSDSVIVDGTLRYAITNALDGDLIRLDGVTPGETVIELGSRLPGITKSITIEGNGVTLTRTSTWTATSADSQLMHINNAAAEVTISRVWFKDGRATDYGAAIRHTSGTLNLESCIFSGNRTSISNAQGGAIDSYGTLNVSGCTFYGNSTADRGGAICNSNGTLTLTGNLFYGNSADIRSPVVRRDSGTVTSNGYNVVDVALGTGETQSGFAANTSYPDKTVTAGVSPVSLVSFRPLSERGATGVITSLPDNYPDKDFYGDPITADGMVAAAAGAVQGTVSGYYLGLSVNSSVRGSVSQNPAPDADGCYSGGMVTITATVAEGYQLGYWLVDGTNAGSTNPLQLILADHTFVQAVFAREFVVTDFSDASGSATVEGRLRHAITNALDGDGIRIGTAGQTIELTAGLPYITKSITIEGNGVTLTRASTWTATSADSQLMYINNATAEVTVSRVRFKDGRATNNGGAININAGNLNLESCIFSGNRTSSSASALGGAIYKAGTGTLNVKSSTFYNNSTTYRGGAVYNYYGTTTLTGNLFYGNTAASGSPVVERVFGTVTSNGYNVVDVALGTETVQSGFAAATGDKTITAGVLPVSPVSFRLLSGSEAVGALTTLPAGYPEFDFYGDPITVGAAAGAVQSTASGSGYTLVLLVNDSARGSISANPAPDTDGIVPAGDVTITATAATNWEFLSWLVDGTDAGSTNPLQLTLAKHTTVQAVFGRIFVVDNFTDASDSATQSGTLRYAITNAVDWDRISVSGTAGQTVIALGSRLPDITRSITIEGNGVTIKPGDSWPNTQLMYITGGTSTIRRVHFKDGRATNSGVAVYISSNGTVNLESCIFSGNQGSGTSADGGAIYNSGTLNVKGCTFYNNSAYRGGVIYAYAVYSSTLNLTGNLFYGNTATAGPIVYRGLGTVTSLGYNVVDVPLGIGTAQSGFASATGDKTIGVLPVSPVTFRLLPGNEAAGVITSLPDNYPDKDFYGDPITAGAAAGAVQGTVSGSGYYLDLSVNTAARGSVGTNPAPDAEGLVSAGNVTITATVTEGYELAHWLVNGTNVGNTNPLQLILTEHTFVHAVFAREFVVTNFTDTSGSATVEGTLRHAMTNALDGDLIRLDGVTAGETVIELNSRLPSIMRNITIEGNGVTLTRAGSWTTVDANSQLMYFNSSSAEVTISRVHFKDGRATSNGGAIRIAAGTVTLESCIFSGNQASSSSAYGGAIYNSGTLHVKSSTFYNNNSAYYGGAIYNTGTLTLTGNLFYGNTANSSGPVVYRNSGTVTSNGYNVVDVALGTGTTQSGFAAATGDTTIEALLGNNTTTPFANAATLAPKSDLSIIPADFAGNMPATDFYGVARTWPGAGGAVK